MRLLFFIWIITNRVERDIIIMIITLDEFVIYNKDANTTDLDLMFLQSAQEVVEHYIGFSIEEKTYTESFDLDKSDFIYLQAPVSNITSIKHNDIDIDTYTVNSNYVIFPYLLSGNVTIVYTGGYSTTNVPASIKEATLQIASAKRRQSGEAIGNTGMSMPNGVTTTYVNYTSFSKFLYPLNQYRLVYA